MSRIVTVSLGGPDNPVLAQGLYVDELNGLTTIKLSDNATVRGRLVQAKVINHDLKLGIEKGKLDG
jgi:hypothetical protein